MAELTRNAQNFKSLTDAEPRRADLRTERPPNAYSRLYGPHIFERRAEMQRFCDFYGSQWWCF